jgi:hypothetical protein
VWFLVDFDSQWLFFLVLWVQEQLPVQELLPVQVLLQVQVLLRVREPLLLNSNRVLCGAHRV